MTTREDLLDMFELMEQNAKNDVETAEINRVRNMNLMFDSSNPDHPTEENLTAAKNFVERWIASTQAFQSRINSALEKLTT